jgi:homoserine O-acetyltransferase
VRRGLELARQIAHLTYRAGPGLELRQGRDQAADPARRDDSWSSRTPYQVHTYLEHQGRKLLDRFDGRAYLAQLDAMDHHDLTRRPGPPTQDETWPANAPAPRCEDVSWGLDRIKASTLAISIDTDQLFDPQHMQTLQERLERRGVLARHRQIQSPHGHDAFLIEFDQVNRFLQEALNLPTR